MKDIVHVLFHPSGPAASRDRAWSGNPGGVWQETDAADPTVVAATDAARFSRVVR